jgi:hypothetical protein
MGIRQLQTYMQEHVPGGYVDVSIKDECEAYERYVVKKSIFADTLIFEKNI